ncbi:M15 family metallopeptidase [Desulfopila aestuarii]|uniref:D-alanyl-D-alanine carboxypeptidase n=1 Tax=Desulfopila aestuarii DSM 18488 TaxID=1121416 RepID=A0A1M7YAA8_9BACT|nr:M15 family metallopeptidase [Desulfopila aestuarii]SHO49575.1 D-alanyl-D-alanine carboxypeptidase [Desulfopila aestuarii DSM 18488]
MSAPHQLSFIARSTISCCLLLLSVSRLLATENNDTTAIIIAPAAPPAETIQIEEKSYQIPRPWVGNRISAPSLPMSAFKMIPVDHTRDSTHIYVVTETHRALVKLLEAAKEDGIVLRIESGYRSPGYQKKIFSRMLDEGRQFEDIIRYVAPPGYSEHALGTAVDFYPSNWEFARLPDYSWLQKHASQYGFTETYPEHNSKHYPWEAWHWTYHKETETAATKQPELEAAAPQG